jgi:hypothetical protein
MPRLEAAGYPVVLHLHDEILSEVPEDFGSKEEFLKIIWFTDRGQRRRAGAILQYQDRTPRPTRCA